MDIQVPYMLDRLVAAGLVELKDVVTGQGPRDFTYTYKVLDVVVVCMLAEKHLYQEWTRTQ